MSLDEAKNHVGSGVVYSPKAYQQPWMKLSSESEVETSLPPKEDGVITSLNDTYVFVRYAGDQTSKATRPEDLELLWKGES